MSGDDVKLTYAKWFWRDWMADLELRQCSPAARGIWIDMLCAMGMNMGRPGYLEISGVPLDVEGVAKLCAVPIDIAQNALAELEKHHVFSRTRDQTIYSRRLVREELKRKAIRMAGTKGGQATRDAGKGIFRASKRNDEHEDRHDGEQPAERANGHAPKQPHEHESSPHSHSHSHSQAKNQNPTSESPPVTQVHTREKISEEKQKWWGLRTRLVDLYESRNCATPIDTHRVEIWQASNFDPDLCLTVVREALSRKAGFHPSLKYFDAALKEQHEKVWALQKASDGVPKPPARDWDRIVKIFIETRGQAWAAMQSPRPGMAGCQVPREVIAKYLDQLKALGPALFSTEH